MKKIIILLTSIFLTSIVVNAEEKKTLEELIGKENISDCTNKHKISPAAFGCTIKKMFKKKDGTPNALGKFYNAKTLKDLWKK